MLECPDISDLLMCHITVVNACLYHVPRAATLLPFPAFGKEFPSGKEFGKESGKDGKEFGKEFWEQFGRNIFCRNIAIAI